MSSIDDQWVQSLGVKSSFKRGDTGITVTQDVTEHLAEAKLLRDAHSTGGRFSKKLDTGFRHIGIIPDSVGLDIMTKYGVDIHDPNINNDQMKYFIQILKTHYPHLLIHNIQRGGR